jgi:hypothetical protein
MSSGRLKREYRLPSYLLSLYSQHSISDTAQLLVIERRDRVKIKGIKDEVPPIVAHKKVFELHAEKHLRPTEENVR